MMSQLRTAIAALCLAGALTTAALVPAAMAEDKAEDPELDYVGLAARLLKDGHFERADAALAEVDLSLPGTDLQRFHTLRGLVALKKRAFAGARDAFQAALSALTAQERGDEPLLLLYLAQSNFGLEDHAATLEVLDRAGTRLDDEVSAHLMRAQAHWALKSPEKALGALAKGKQAFPNVHDFARMQVFYLIELGLYQEVMGLGRAYLERADVKEQDYVAIGEALRKGKQLDKAGLILEGAQLRFPESVQVKLALAHIYLDRGRPLSAAMLLEDAARLDPKYTVEAAELYKQAGRLERALSLNARVGDQQAKLKQRLSILLSMESFELVAAMAPALSRTGLLNDDDVRYALAYGYYKIGEFNEAEAQLKRISDAELFNNANQLRKAMESCRRSGWECI